MPKQIKVSEEPLVSLEEVLEVINRVVSGSESLLSITPENCPGPKLYVSSSGWTLSLMFRDGLFDGVESISSPDGIYVSYDQIYDYYTDLDKCLEKSGFIQKL